MILLGIFIYKFIGKDEPGGPKVDDNLVGIVNDWNKLMDKNGILHVNAFNRIVEIKIVKSAELEGSDHGAAESNLMTRRIYISVEQIQKGYWATKGAVYHELGHYIFNLPHDESKPDIMNAVSLTNNEYKIDWRELEQTYVDKCKSQDYEARF
jgi:hypothetical protein